LSKISNIIGFTKYLLKNYNIMSCSCKKRDQPKPEVRPTQIKLTETKPDAGVVLTPDQQVQVELIVDRINQLRR